MAMRALNTALSAPVCSMPYPPAFLAQDREQGGRQRD